jgi:hypothetical protein
MNTTTECPFTEDDLEKAHDAAQCSNTTGSVKTIAWTEGVGSALHYLADTVALPLSGGIEYRSSTGWRVRCITKGSES